MNRRTIFIVTALVAFGLLFTGSYLTTRRHSSVTRDGVSYFTSTDPPASSTLRAPAGDPLPYCTNMYHAICGKTGETHDPTGSVIPDLQGEIQALKTFEEIIREHPDWESEKVDEELVNRIYTPKRRQRIEAVYHWVHHQIVQFIEKQPENVFNRHEKDQLKRRLSKIELQLPPPAAAYADEPDLFTKNDVFYERGLDGKMRMRFGGAFFFSNKSWFNMVFTIAHEMGHAIDPCEIRSARLSFPAYDRLAACFMTEGLISMKKSRDECGDNDQLSETFADWLAVQVTYQALLHYATEFHGPQLLNATTNAVRDLCEQETDAEDLDTEFHPPPTVRIQKIFGDNPAIRYLLGCAVEPEQNTQYCNLR